MNGEVARIASTPDHRALLEKNSFDVMAVKPEALPVFAREEREQWGRIIREAGIKPP